MSESHLGDSDMMEVDEEFFFNQHRIVGENEELDVDKTFHLDDLQLSDQSDSMEINETIFFRELWSHWFNLKKTFSTTFFYLISISP